ncbi:endonuclease/exonuclease/phosphatase family protein [Luteolibacter sp. GHJ8]|uniref:Endonuclease/exonuclease/phosphatase family protein n=1 Tax=Luteolibacter rhizosphaerae TaxID=2989719 RepID=A0ABT3FZT0_9BACT|nr:endonuclease/exonuclease/phosphatase family protein [Luteolibacter rhizosphaerae]MCW1913099.1 endonuclease/exonuclease/phosphatase family protein [Luteolibacter rhizosphaerae]
MKRVPWMRLLRGVALSGLILAWLGLACRGRDGSAIAATLYYGTPWLLRLLAGLLAVIVLRHWGFRLMAGTCLLLSVLEGWHSFRLDPVPSEMTGSVRASIYNAGRTLESDPATWSALAEADISAVVESGDFTEESWRGFLAAGSGMEWKTFGGTLLGVRGKILGHESLGIYNRYRCYRVRVSLPEHGEFMVIVVDVRSQPWLSRDQAMSGVLQAAGDDPKVVVLGDFNTPPESKWYERWQGKLALANNAPRRGFRETWAFGVPLLTLDQIWTGSGWHAQWVEHSRHGSDHSRVRVILKP